MKYKYENGKINRYGRIYNLQNETDMQILCDEINAEIESMGLENTLLRNKLNIIKDIAERYNH